MPRPVREWRSASRENYKEFKKSHPKTSITFTDFHNIIYTWNGLFMKEVMETGEKIKIPHGMGPICITKYRPKSYIDKDGNIKINLAVDWVKTREEGKVIYNLNHHSDGYKYYFNWAAQDSYLKAPKMWSLKVARKHSRKLASIIKDASSNLKDKYKQWVIK